MSEKATQEYRPVPLPDYRELPVEEMRARAQAFYDEIRTRHTVRDFQPHALTIDEMGQLLWAAQGVTHEGHKRTAPSASSLRIRMLAKVHLVNVIIMPK